MAKGLEKHRQRHSELSLFGKTLTRRAKHHCELCQASGVSLNIFEVPPVPNEPVLEHCAFICQTCLDQFNAKQLDGNHLRALNHSVWSEVPAVQVAALLLLRKLGADWSDELLEQVYLQPEIEEWVHKAEKVS